MLNPEQREYITSLKKEQPVPGDASVTEMLKGAAWPEDEIHEALGILHAPEQLPVPSSNIGVPHSDRESESTLDTAVPAEHTHSLKSAIALIGVLICMVAGASGYYAYTQGIFSPVVTLSPDNVVSQILSKLQDIQTAQYTTGFELSVSDRDPDAKPFMMEESIDPVVMAQYKRDQDRFRDLEKIRSKLGEVYFASSTYPTSLKGLDLAVVDPLGKPYLYTLNGTDSYSLQVTFETPEAVGVVRGSSYSGDVEHETSEPLDPMTVILTPDEYFYSYMFDGRPEEPKFLGIFDLASVEEYLPGNMEAKFAIEGVIDRSTTLPLNTRVKVAGDASFGDFQFAFDMEGMKIGEKYYGIVNKLPSFFSMLSQIKGVWVMATEEELRGSDFGSIVDAYIPSEENERTEEIQKLHEQAKKIIEIADQTGLLVMTEGPVTEKKETETVVRYTLALATDKVLPFYESVVTALNSYEHEALIQRDESLITYLKSDDYAKVSEYLKDNVTFTLLTDTKGILKTMELHSRYIPSDKARALAGKQVNTTLTLTFWDINKPVVLSEPVEATSFDDFMGKITGKSKEELILERQQNQVEVIRSSLETYHYFTGKYPSTLTDLTKKIEGTENASDVDMDIDGYNSYNSYQQEFTPLRSVPKDVYTGSEFVYVLDENDYALTYTIKLAPYSKGKDPQRYYTYGEASSQPSEELLYESLDSGYLLVPVVRDGSNTATAEYSSDVQLLTTDTDLDELSDELEKILGTDPQKADTDGDTFTDGEEIQTNSDPLGPGKLETNSSSFGIF